MEKPKIMKNKWSFVPIAVLLILVVSEFTWYSPYTLPRPTSLQMLYSNSTKNALNIEFRISANLPSNVTVVGIPVMTEPEDLPVYVFYDENYSTQGIGSDWGLIHRLWEHLKIDLKLRNYYGDVGLVDAKELQSIFISNESAVVVMAYGAFPSNVFSWETNLVKPWIQSGGILIWFGWEPGYYTVDREQKYMSSEMPNQLHFEGIERLGFGGIFQVTFGEPYWITCEVRSHLSEALDIRYNLIRAAPLFEKVIEAGGLALGKVGEVNSTTRISVSAIPLDRGQLVAFGRFIENMDESNPLSFYSVSRDISQILCSGVLHTSSALEFWHKNYLLSAGETKFENFTIPLSPNVKGVVLYGYNSIESTGLLFFRDYIPI
jgi:hypothetical protein